MMDDEKIPSHIHDQVKLCVGKKQAIKLPDLGSPTPQRIIILGVVPALLMPDERQPFSIVSVADLMASLFNWNPMKTLKEINNFLELCGQKSGPKFDCYRDKSGLIHVNLPNELHDRQGIVEPCSSARTTLCCSAGPAKTFVSPGAK
jgi:hypothetical protein